MITTPTVFILGAGASAPYGYPTAKELKRDILDSLKDEQNMDFQTLVSCGFEPEDIDNFRQNFFLSSQNSVDAFLERRTEYINVGKAAIAQQLIKAEDVTNIPKLFEDGWYSYLLNRMDCKFEDFENNKISFITFNYDRSLEFFLAIALLSRYGKNLEDISSILKSIPIIHVYGQLGALDWQSTDRDQIREYGTSDYPNNIKKAASGIKIVSEAESNDTPALLQARKLIMKSDRIIFLGFGYHAENMDRLKLPLENALKFFGGSAMGLTETERNHLTHAKYHGLHLGDPHWDALRYLRTENKLASN